MDNMTKAKIIIELLDDRKYSVLSSFSSQELSKLTSVDLEMLDNLSSTEINDTISSFLKSIESRIEKEEEKPEIIEETVVIKKPEKEKKSKSKSKDVSVEKEMASVTEKIKLQPPQLIACVLNKIDDNKRKYVLSKLAPEKKALVESIEVETAPISDQIVNVILKEFDLVTA